MLEVTARPRNRCPRRKSRRPLASPRPGVFLAVSLLPFRHRLIYQPEKDEQAGGPKVHKLVYQELPLLCVGEASSVRR